MPGNWELILILLVVVVVFGSKRLPDSARALGRSMRILKAETKGLRDDDGAPTTTAQLVTPSAGPTVQPVMGQPVMGNGVPAQPYAGQQLFDAQGRPVQVPPVAVQPVQGPGQQPSGLAGSQQVQPAQQAPSAQA